MIKVFSNNKMEGNKYNITKKEENKREFETIKNDSEKNTKKMKWNPIHLFCCLNNKIDNCL